MSRRAQGSADQGSEKSGPFALFGGYKSLRASPCSDAPDKICSLTQKVEHGLRRHRSRIRQSFRSDERVFQRSTIR